MVKGAYNGSRLAFIFRNSPEMNNIKSRAWEDIATLTWGIIMKKPGQQKLCQQKQPIRMWFGSN